MSLIINTHFTKNSISETGLSPIIRIWEVNDITDTLVIIDQPMVEIGDGFYKYVFTVGNGYDEQKAYVIRSDANTVSLANHERFSVATINESTISQNTIDNIVDSVWDETATSHIVTGSTGLLLNQISADTTQLRIDNTLQISLLELLLKYETNKTKIDKINFTLTIFDDDGVTPLTVFDLKDSTGSPSIVEICERVPQ